MTADELLALYKQYVECMDRVNPVLELMKQEEIEALVEDIKKKDQPLVSTLTRLSFWERVSILHYLLTKSD